MCYSEAFTMKKWSLILCSEWPLMSCEVNETLTASTVYQPLHLHLCMKNKNKPQTTCHKNKPVSRLVKSCLRWKNSSNQDGLYLKQPGGSVHLWAYHLSCALAASDSKGQPHLQRPAQSPSASTRPCVWSGIQLATLPDLRCLIRARFRHLKQVSGSFGRSGKESGAKKMLRLQVLTFESQIKAQEIKAKVYMKSGSSYKLLAAKNDILDSIIRDTFENRI